MARLTVEDKWWSDPRREKLGRLLGDIALADANALRMWRLAQEFWGNSLRLIPQEIFDTLEAAPKLLEAGLASAKEGGIYVRGSSQYLSWLHESRLAASAGGQKSAEVRRKKYGTSQPQRRSDSEPPLEANSKCLEPSVSVSVSDSKKEEYTSGFEELWGHYGKEGSKRAAFQAYQKQRLSPEEIGVLKKSIQAYHAKRLKRDQSPKHFSTFLNDDWRAYLESDSSDSPTLDFTLSTEAHSA